MASDEMDDNLRAEWQNQPAEERPLSLEEIRAKAQWFEKRIRRRNIREHFASTMVIVIFGAYIVLLEPMLFRVGSALVIAGALVFMYSLRQRGGIRTLPADLPLTSCRDFYRRELERQRDLVTWVAWAFVPFLPGVTVFIAGVYLLPRGGAVIGTTVTVVMAVTFVIVWLLNRRAGRRLQRMIDQLR